MRKLKYAIGSLCLAVAVSFAAIAQAAVTSQEVHWQPDPSPLPQFKKGQKGGIGFGVYVQANYDNLTRTSPAAAGMASPSAHAELAVIHFDKDIAINPGTIAQCPKASINTASTDAAKAACPGSILGSGEAHLNGIGGPGSAVVTAFNGVTSAAGEPVIELHARTGASLGNLTSVLTGTVQPSTKAAAGYGKQLRVPVAPLVGGSEVILDFSTVLSKLVSKPGGKAASAAKKKKKKKKPATFFLSANCSDKVWNIEGDFTFVDSPGGAAEPTVTLTGKDTAPCKQKAQKKKKKKKK